MPVKKSWSCWWSEGSGHYTTACTFTGSGFRFPCSMMWPKKATEFTWNSHFSPFTKSLFSKKWWRICLTWTWCSATAFEKKNPMLPQGKMKSRWCLSWVIQLCICPFLHSRAERGLINNWREVGLPPSGIGLVFQIIIITFLGGEAGGVASHRQFKWWSVIWINNERTTRRKNVFVYLQNQNLIFNHFKIHLNLIQILYLGRTSSWITYSEVLWKY